ncbi:MAG: hypothetical protein K6E22_14580 [Treponema sp.]|nr:hypothetical protein [Treponema sp.]
MAEEEEKETTFDYTTGQTESSGSQENQEGDSKKRARDTAEEIGKTILEYIDKGVEAGKKGLRTAGVAISDLGDKSVKSIELQQLKMKKNKALAQLGKYVWETLKTGGENAALTSSDEKIKYYMEGLDKLQESIEAHEKFFEEAKAKNKAAKEEAKD